MNSTGQRVHNQFEAISKRRQKATGVLKKAAWALYDKKNLEGLVDNIVVLIGELEQEFPVENAYYKLAEMEIEEVEDEPSLAMIKQAAEGLDGALLEAADQKLKNINGRNAAEDVQTEGKARVNVGSVFSTEALAHDFGIIDTTSNSVRNVVAKGESRVQIGNTYGKGI